MKTRTVKQYSCDFCDKRGLSAGHMRTHEKHCTLNPERECRVCKMVDPGRKPDFVQRELVELIAVLPIANDEPWDYRNAEIAAAVPMLREAAGDCPACMLAALRQAKIPVPLAAGFDFSAEMKEIWAGINEDAYERGRGDV